MLHSLGNGCRVTSVEGERGFEAEEEGDRYRGRGGEGEDRGSGEH